VRVCIPPIVARQRLSKNPLIVARQRLSRNVTAVTNTQARSDTVFYARPYCRNGTILSFSSTSPGRFTPREYKAGYALQPVRGLSGKENILPLPGVDPSFLGHRTCRPLTIPTELLWLQYRVCT
jgi:hypothetical protein